MLILNWQELVPEMTWKNYQALTNYPWPGSILAASIPIHSPHTLFHVSEKQLQILEILQGRILLPNQTEVEEVSLPLQSIAMIWHNSTVASIYEGEPKDIGLWLQKYGTWSSSHKLVIASLQEFVFPFVYRKSYQGNIGTVSLEIKVKLDKNNLVSFIKAWLISRAALHLHDIYISFETFLEESHFLFGFSHDFEKMFLDEVYREKIFPLEEEILVHNFQKKGLLLSVLPVEWHWKKAKQSQELNIVSSSIPSRESVTQKIERQRVEKLAEDIAFVSKNKKEKMLSFLDDLKNEDKFLQ